VVNIYENKINTKILPGERVHEKKLLNLNTFKIFYEFKLFGLLMGSSNRPEETRFCKNIE